MHSNYDPAFVTALVVCAGYFAALVIWIVLARRCTKFTFAQSTLLLVNAFFTRVLWRTTVSGPLPIADHQGALIVSNHSSGVDPLVIQLCTNRIVHWMVAKEYYYAPIITVVFRTLRSIPVNRGGVDTASTKAAIRLAEQGGLVGLFPEGRVNTTGELLLPGRPGAALIALKARVNVIPCYVSGVPYDNTALGSFFMAGRGRVRVGQPIDLTGYFGREADRATLQELTKRFLVEIARLAGDDHFEPKLAGKNWKPGFDGDNGNGDSNGQAEVVAPSTTSAD